jgi:glycosyltransferase involved in cell wall biosynthesis
MTPGRPGAGVATDGRVNVLHTLPDLAVAGGQRVVLDLVRRLDPDRFAVTVVSLSGDGGMGPRFEGAGLAPVVLPHGGRLGRAATLGALARLIVDRDIDIVHVHGSVELPYAVAAAALTRRPLVRHVHGLGRRSGDGGLPPPSPPTGARRLISWARSRLVQRSFVTVSEAAYRDRLAAASATGESVYLVTNGIDPAPYEHPLGAEYAAALRADLAIQDASPVLVDVAALRPKKGHLDLVAALPAIRDRWPAAVLLLVGDGPMRDELEDAARDLGLNDAVRLLGARDDVAAVLSVSDVFVFPSHSEGFPLAPLEAMASGTPVVGYRIPALEAFVTDGETGVLTPVGDADKLAAGVLALLDDPPRAHRIAAAGRSLAVERYTIDRSARTLERVYEDVLASSRRWARKCRTTQAPEYDRGSSSTR